MSYRQQEECEEHYVAVAQAISKLWNGIGDEDDVRLVCQAAAIDERDLGELQCHESAK